MDTTVVPVALRRHTEEGVKPAMAGQTPLQEPAPAVVADQGRSPVDPLKKPPAPLGSVLGIKMSPGLRAAVAYRAQQDGMSDSAWLRHLVLRELGLESETDAVTGPRPRIPPEELAALAGCVREIGVATQHATLGQTKEVIASLGRIRGVLIPTCVGLAGRCA
ncbi:hypothetical protein C0214_10885 [Methylobacterium sp. DM1]|nr:hypothetical protein C0214_10885 [Methylobacterium sp. DM1]